MPSGVSSDRVTAMRFLHFLFFRFDGRIARRQFWLGYAANIMAGAVLGGIAGVIFEVSAVASGVRDSAMLVPRLAGAAVGLALVWPTLAVFAKRFHDRNKSGWFAAPIALLSLAAVPAQFIPMPAGAVALLAIGVLQVPLVLWLVVELGCLRGTRGRNRFGPEPIGLWATPETTVGALEGAATAGRSVLLVASRLVRRPIAALRRVTAAQWRRAGATTAVVLAALVAADALLTVAALNDPSRAAPLANGVIATDTASQTSLRVYADGAVRLTGASGSAVLVAGPPVRAASALLLGGAGRAVISDARGEVRVVAAPPPSLASTVASIAFRDVWRPVGAPVAAGALWLTAQLMPVELPAALAGNAGASVRSCASDCPAMVELGPGATFLGRPIVTPGPNPEGAMHLAVSAQPFAISRTPITVGEWQACSSAAFNPCALRAQPRGATAASPVVNVSPRDVDSYLAWLSARTGATYRLPTLLEWTYAMRADSAAHGGTAPGSNRFGLARVDGAISEMTRDCTTNANNQTTCLDRAAAASRWGPWGQPAALISAGAASSGRTDVGFRVALSTGWNVAARLAGDWGAGTGACNKRLRVAVQGNHLIVTGPLGASPTEVIVPSKDPGKILTEEGSDTVTYSLDSAADTMTVEAAGATTTFTRCTN